MNWDDHSDAHSFHPTDPPITMPRRLAVELLEQVEMYADIVESRVRRDPGQDRVIAELTTLLTRGGQP